jgi:hypothetical protein
MVSGAVVLIDPNWAVTHVVDLDGDGRSDLVWRNAATGQTALWRMDGTAFAAGAIVLTNAAWSVVKTGDLDGDGRGDLVWRNATTGENRRLADERDSVRQRRHHQQTSPHVGEQRRRLQW